MRAKKKTTQEAWNRFADAARVLLVGAATGLPRRNEANRARVGAGTCLVAVRLSMKILKHSVSERRPNGEDNKSFPSEHAAESIAAALIIQREYRGLIGAGACGLAACVAWSRIRSKKHHPRDVLVGALIGCTSVWLSLRLRLAVERRMLAAH